MSTWYRVFAKNNIEPDPDALCAVMGSEISCQCRAGERGWQRLQFAWPSGQTLAIDRFWRDEEGIRAELQAWAAWLETLENEPKRDALMQHLTATQQVFTMLRESSNDPIALKLCEAIAWTTDGVYEIDKLGFFSHDGTLLALEGE